MSAPSTAPDFEQQGWKRITLAEARKLCQKPGALIWWRPEPNLPENEQYALVRA